MLLLNIRCSALVPPTLQKGPTSIYFPGKTLLFVIIVKSCSDEGGRFVWRQKKFCNYDILKTRGVTRPISLGGGGVKRVSAPQN